MRKLNLLTVMLSSFILSGCIEDKLPKCDSREVKKILTQIEDSSQRTLISSVTSIPGIKQVNFNKKDNIRYCRASVILSEYGGRKSAGIEYKISWDSSSDSLFRKGFIVEITKILDFSELLK